MLVHGRGRVICTKLFVFDLKVAHSNHYKTIIWHKDIVHEKSCSQSLYNAIVIQCTLPKYDPDVVVCTVTPEVTLVVADIWEMSPMHSSVEENPSQVCKSWESWNVWYFEYLCTQLSLDSDNIKLYNRPVTNIWVHVLILQNTWEVYKVYNVYNTEFRFSNK